MLLSDNKIFLFVLLVLIGIVKHFAKYVLLLFWRELDEKIDTNLIFVQYMQSCSQQTISLA